MIMKSLVKSAAALLLGGAMVASTANAAEFEMRQASDLDDLLKLVKERALFESAINKKDREREFIQKKAQQQSMLNSAKAERTAQEQRSDRLETQFEENERRLGQLQEQLDTRLGSLRELFGVLQQVAGDTVGVFEGSVVSAQFPGRGEPSRRWLPRWARARSSASIEEIEELWIALQQQMTETGKVVSFPGTVIEADGGQTATTITRVGDFNLVTDAGYVNFDPNTQNIVALARRPSSRFTATVDGLQGASTGTIVPSPSTRPAAPCSRY